MENLIKAKERNYDLWHQYAFHPDLKDNESFCMLLILHLIRVKGKAELKQVYQYFDDPTKAESGLDGLTDHDLIRIDHIKGTVKTFKRIPMVDVPDTKMRFKNWKVRLQMLRQIQLDDYAQTWAKIHE